MQFATINEKRGVNATRLNLSHEILRRVFRLTNRWLLSICQFVN